jgi:hypothetical protein
MPTALIIGPYRVYFFSYDCGERRHMDERTVSVPIGWYPRLAYGTPAERANIMISNAGYGVY